MEIFFLVVKVVTVCWFQSAKLIWSLEIPNV